MAITTVGFLILGFVLMIVAFILEGGHVEALLAPTAAMIVIGGTIAAVGVSFPFKEIKNVGKILKVAFSKKEGNLSKLTIYFKNLATQARKEGLLSIEGEISKDAGMDPFIKKGLSLVVDGVDPQSVRIALELQTEMMSKRHKSGIEIFESAGGFAPTMGILGTVMGLVHILGNLEDAASLGPSIAVAFLATLYGIGTANLIYLPIANQLKALNHLEINEKSLIIEAILSIQEGANPNLMIEKLKGFLDAEELEEIKKLDGTVE